MKILILMGKFAGGGAQRVVSHLSQHLPSNFNVTILITDPKVDYPYRGELRLLELKKFTGKYQYHTHIIRLWQKYAGVRRVIRESSPDVVVAFDPGWGFLAVVLSCRGVVSIRNTLSLSYGREFYKKFIMRFIGRRAYKLICVSQGVKDDLEDTYKVFGSSVIYNPIDLDLVAQEKIKSVEPPIVYQWKSTGIPVVITLGRRSPQKGQHHLIRAFAHVRRQMNAKLILVGLNKEDDKFLDDLVTDLALQDDVLFAGFRSPFLFLAAADIFVLPSLYEGFPNACLEAMACGLPIIATDCPSGPREILAPDTDYRYQTKVVELAKYGILTPVCDGRLRPGREPLIEEELLMADALSSLLADKEMRRSYAEASLVRAKDFNLDQFIQQWVRVLQ